MTPGPAQQELSVVVVDAATGRLVAGATVEIIDANGQIVATFVTDGHDPAVIPLPPGNYTLRATALCDGSSDDQSATVPGSGNGGVDGAVSVCTRPEPV
jgi:hypothetical protein